MLLYPLSAWRQQSHPQSCLIPNVHLEGLPVVGSGLLPVATFHVFSRISSSVSLIRLAVRNCTHYKSCLYSTNTS